MTVPIRRTPANEEHEAIFQELVAQAAICCQAHPSVKNIELIAILARTVGYCIALCLPDERDLARETAIVNIDQATADAARPGPPTAGRA